MQRFGLSLAVIILAAFACLLPAMANAGPTACCPGGVCYGPVPTIPPLTLIAARVTVASVFLCAVMAASGVRFPRGPAIWRTLLVQSLFSAAITTVFSVMLARIYLQLAGRDHA